MSNEERARRMGWVPKEEFKGDPEKWVDADTFVDRGENMMPLLKENLTRMESKFTTLEQDYKAQSAKLDKVTTSLEKLAEWHKSTAQRSYERAKRDIKKQMREAAAAGDVEKFDKLSAEADSIIEEASGAASPSGEQQPQQSPQSIHPDWPEWHKQNMWFGQDEVMTAYANYIGPQVGSENPGLDGKAFFDTVRERVKEKFPENFSDPAKSRPNAVEGDSGGGGESGSKKKKWSDIPKDDQKEIMENFSDLPGFDRESYARDYWAQEEA